MGGKYGWCLWVQASNGQRSLCWTTPACVRSPLIGCRHHGVGGAHTAPLACCTPPEPQTPPAPAPQACPLESRASAQMLSVCLCLCVLRTYKHTHTGRHTQSTDSCGTHALQDKHFYPSELQRWMQKCWIPLGEMLGAAPRRWLCFLAWTLMLPVENYDEQIESIPWRHQSNGDNSHGDCAEFENTKHTRQFGLWKKKKPKKTLKETRCGVFIR